MDHFSLLEQACRENCCTLVIYHDNTDGDEHITTHCTPTHFFFNIYIYHIFPNGAIAHTSRTMTPQEKNGGRIEKEAFALAPTMKKFHKFLHDRHFTLLTEHRQLLSIFGSKRASRHIQPIASRDRQPRVLVDVLWKWPELTPVNPAASSCTITALRRFVA